ncbi:MAG: HD domain-containing protein [Patescibacteria group bacterium]
MKIITDPIYGVIDISPVLPMIEAPEFQALHDKQQLGLTALVYRSATHTRFAHSVGAYHRTRLLTDRFLTQGRITKVEAEALCAFALYHDIGHGPLSHVTEDFYPDHKEKTAELVSNLRGPIELCGVDTDLMLQMARHEHPLAMAVYDKNVGTEKMDYLARDGMNTILCQPAGLAYLPNYVLYHEGQIAIDSKAIEPVLDLMNFYMRMFKEVYFRKALVIAQRMLHKAIHLMMVVGELDSQRLSKMTASELCGAMSVSKKKTVCHLYYCYKTRHLFKEAIVIRPEKFAEETRIAHKAIKVFTGDAVTMNKLLSAPHLQKANHEKLLLLECDIARLANVASRDVLLVPPFNPERFEAKDVPVLLNNGELCSLKANRPAHFASMDEIAHSYQALRVCVHPMHRELFSEESVACKVRDLLCS